MVTPYPFQLHLPCRASTAATKCQTQLQSVTEKDTEGLKERIAAAEAAVQEAEQSAAEAVRLQNEIVQAASMAEGHADTATSQSSVAERVGTHGYSAVQSSKRLRGKMVLGHGHCASLDTAVT